MLFRFVFQTVAKILHSFVKLKQVNRLKEIQVHFYSQWIRNEFAECGSHVVFQGFSVLYGTKHIHLGDQIYIGKDVVWEVIEQYNDQFFSPSLTIGDHCGFGDNGHISCCNHIEIGNGVRIGRKALIIDNTHGSADRLLLDIPAHHRPLVSKGPVIIEENVWIGEMACILPGVTIGKGSIVGANAVVTHSIPPYSMVAGNPACVIKRLGE